MFKSRLCTFDNGVARKARVNANTKNAFYVLNENGTSTAMPGRVDRAGNFKFKNQADEVRFRNHKWSKLAYDNYGQTAEEKLKAAQKRHAEKMNAFRSANKDEVRCVDGVYRRVYYTNFDKTHGFISMKNGNKRASVFGSVHNGMFTHNARYNRFFPIV